MKKPRIVELIAEVDTEKVLNQKLIKKYKSKIGRLNKELNKLDNQKRHLHEMLNDES